MEIPVFIITLVLGLHHGFCDEAVTETTVIPWTDDVTSQKIFSTFLDLMNMKEELLPEFSTIASINDEEDVKTNCDRRWSLKDYMLEHPRFPEEYSNNVLCRYTISKNSDIICGLEITFNKFDLETSSGCEKDFFAIGDERLCGHIPTKSMVQYPFEEESDDIIVVFGTNDNVTKSGFQIFFQQISICEEDLNAISAVHACDVLITDPSGELVTHRTPEDALGNPVCRYTIGRRHSGFCQVELDFIDFNVDYSSSCIGSYVQLDGHRFCGTSLRGQRKNVTFDALGNVHIIYKTETVRMDRGFHLLFRQLVCLPGNAVRSPGGSDIIGDRLPSSCSKVYYEKEFYIESPGFSSFYANDLDCQLVIRRYSPSICSMDIRFLDFDVEESPGCVYDFLQLDSRRLCGRIPEDNVEILDFPYYEKILRFKTDSVNPRPGFFLYVRQLDCGSSGSSPAVPVITSSCDIHVWNREARISSPNYPRNYGNDHRCRYYVHREGTHICQLRVTFLDFRLQNGNPGCYQDFLEMDGGWRACGDKFQGITRTLDFRSPEKILFFSSDSWITYPGFLLSLKQIPCVEASQGDQSGRLNGEISSCDRQFEANAFEMRSEQYPLNYPPDLNCRYVIRKVSESICQLRIRFLRFDIEKSVACSRDYLALDGERLCGALPINTTRVLRFDSTEKVLLFRSNGQAQGPGFSASIGQIDCRRFSQDTTSSDPTSSSDITAPTTPPSSATDGSCDRHFYEIRSSFNSPDYPSFYPTNMACRYNLHIQTGYCNVEFTFLDFSLEQPSPGLPCSRDFLDISGVRYCGRQLQGLTKIESPLGSSKEIVLTFFSDSLVTDKGILASFRQLQCERSSSDPSLAGVCGGHLTGRYFEITWPDLRASGDYGQSVQCTYNIHRLSSETCSIRVTFAIFDLGDGRDCPRQFVQIGEHTLCGSLPSYTIRDYDFLDYTLVLRAISSQLPRPRMHLQIQQIPCGSNILSSRLPPPNCDQTFDGPGFELRSPYYPHGLTSGLDCRYIVRKSSPFVCHLELTFERFQLAESRQCYVTHLRIDTNRLCGSLAPYSVRVYAFDTTEKLMHFRADNVIPGTGFLIRGRQVPCGGSPPGAHRQPPSIVGSSDRNIDASQSSRRCDQSFGLDEFSIFSPNHPLHYPTSVVCRYIIIRSSADVCGLEITFINFDLEDYYHCQRDYLDVDGEKLCGALPPQSIRNYSFHPADRTKLLVFRSDYAVTRPGFAIQIRQTRTCPPAVPSLLPTTQTFPSAGGGTSSQPSRTTCETEYFANAKGFFRSSRFPSGYPASHCLITFVQLRGFCSVRLVFHDFDLLLSTECLVDYLEVETRRYCDRQLFQQSREVFFPWRDSSTATFIFHSERGSFMNRGFSVDYEQMPCRRQGRQHREELEYPAFLDGTSRAVATNAPDVTSVQVEEPWDDTRNTAGNSTAQYRA